MMFTIHDLDRPYKDAMSPRSGQDNGLIRIMEPRVKTATMVWGTVLTKISAQIVVLRGKLPAVAQSDTQKKRLVKSSSSAAQTLKLLRFRAALTFVAH